MNFGSGDATPVYDRCVTRSPQKSSTAYFVGEPTEKCRISRYTRMLRTNWPIDLMPFAKGSACLWVITLMGSYKYVVLHVQWPNP